MISSMVLTLNTTAASTTSEMAMLADRPDIEVGDLIDNRLLPITIEANDSHSLEETTRWVQDLEFVQFLDVVFVHLENSEETRHNVGAKL